MSQPSRQPGAFLWVALVVVGANYLAQVPYYLHLYYIPHGLPPAWGGVAMLALTLVWFVAGWVGMARGKTVGYWLLVTFFEAEVGFYAYNMVNQVAHGYSPFFHLQTRDPILFVVFGIGYLNFLAGIAFLAYLVWRRRTLVAREAVTS